MTKSLLSITALRKKNSTSSSITTSNTVWVIGISVVQELRTVILNCSQWLIIIVTDCFYKVKDRYALGYDVGLRNL